MNSKTRAMFNGPKLTQFPSMRCQYQSIPLRASTVRRACALISPTIDAAGLCELASHDPGFSLQLLRLANRAAETQIFRLEDAIFSINVESIQDILMQFSPNSPSDEAESIGAHSRLTGLLARRLAELTSDCDPAQVYMAGLLHDIGKLALLSSEVTSSHSSVGKDLAVAAQLPSFIIDAIANHHRPQAAEVNPQIVRIVSIADQFARGMAATAAVDQTSASDMLRSGIALFQRSDPSTLFNFFMAGQAFAMDYPKPSLFNRCTQ